MENLKELWNDGGLGLETRCQIRHANFTYSHLDSVKSLLLIYSSEDF